MNNKESEFIRTTIWIPRKLHEEAKIMTIITRTNLSAFMRIALREKIKALKADKNK